MLNFLTRALYPKLLAQLGLGVWIGWMTVLAHAQAPTQNAWPQKPIRWIIPYAAGGGTDAIMRPIAQKTSELLGQSIVYENRGNAPAMGIVLVDYLSNGVTFVSATGGGTDFVARIVAQGVGEALERDAELNCVRFRLLTAGPEARQCHQADRGGDMVAIVA